VLGVSGILREWVKFRIECIRRQLEFDIKNKSDKLHLLQGLEKILLDIDKAVAIVRGTSADAEVVPNLMKGFAIDEPQAEFVADIKLRNLNKEYILNRTKDIEDLLDDIANMKSILGSEAKIKGVIIDDLKRIEKKYGAPRRTDLVDGGDTEEVDLSIPIEDYALKAFVTAEGYFKKISLVSLRSSGEHKLKEGDKIVWEQEGKNKDELLVFTDKCSVYKMKLHEIPDTKASLMGEYLPALMRMEADENPIFTVLTGNFKGHLLFCFENGKMAKIPLTSYETVTNRKKLTAAYYAGSKLICIHELNTSPAKGRWQGEALTEGFDFETEEANPSASLHSAPPLNRGGMGTEFVAISSNQKVLVFDAKNINEKTTRSSQGVSVLTLKKGATLTKVLPAHLAGLADLAYYRTKNIPAIGCFLKKEDSQQSFI
ncbi:MAG: topoisomerase IV, partial [Oscillospiraceae bacterium]|nr:topoisomerase IV [Oscillospiraceae bacterium]